MLHHIGRPGEYDGAGNRPKGDCGAKRNVVPGRVPADMQGPPAWPGVWARKFALNPIHWSVSTGGRVSPAGMVSSAGKK